MLHTRSAGSEMSSLTISFSALICSSFAFPDVEGGIMLGDGVGSVESGKIDSRHTGRAFADLLVEKYHRNRG